eukprot:Nk52_evm15s288 gene=Nk52_evmTU15s288
MSRVIMTSANKADPGPGFWLSFVCLWCLIWSAGEVLGDSTSSGDVAGSPPGSSSEQVTSSSSSVPEEPFFMREKEFYTDVFSPTQKYSFRPHKGLGETASMCTSGNLQHHVYYFPYSPDVGLLNSVQPESFRMGMFKSWGLFYIWKPLKVTIDMEDLHGRVLASKNWHLDRRTIRDGNAVSSYARILTELIKLSANEITSVHAKSFPIIEPLAEVDDEDEDNIERMGERRISIYSALFGEYEGEEEEREENTDVLIYVDAKKLPFSYSVTMVVNETISKAKEGTEEGHEFEVSAFAYDFRIPSSFYHHTEQTPGSGNLFHSLLQTKVSKLNPPPAVPPLFPVLLEKMQPPVASFYAIDTVLFLGRYRTVIRSVEGWSMGTVVQNETTNSEWDSLLLLNNSYVQSLFYGDRITMSLVVKLPPLISVGQNFDRLPEKELSDVVLREANRTLTRTLAETTSKGLGTNPAGWITSWNKGVKEKTIEDVLPSLRPSSEAPTIVQMFNLVIEKRCDPLVFHWSFPTAAFYGESYWVEHIDFGESGDAKTKYWRAKNEEPPVFFLWRQYLNNVGMNGIKVKKYKLGESEFAYMAIFRRATLLSVVHFLHTYNEIKVFLSKGGTLYDSESVLRGDILGATVRRGGKTVPFFSTICITGPLPPPNTLLVMSKMTFLCTLIVMGLALILFYLMIGYTMSQLRLLRQPMENATGAPVTRDSRYIHIHTIMAPLCFLYVWPWALTNGGTPLENELVVPSEDFRSGETSTGGTSSPSERIDQNQSTELDASNAGQSEESAGETDNLLDLQ